MDKKKNPEIKKALVTIEIIEATQNTGNKYGELIGWCTLKQHPNRMVQELQEYHKKHPPQT
jgi:hypothetical protein